MSGHSHTSRYLSAHQLEEEARCQDEERLRQEDIRRWKSIYRAYQQELREWEEIERRKIVLSHFAQNVTPLPSRHWQRLLAKDIYDFWCVRQNITCLVLMLDPNSRGTVSRVDEFTRQM